MSLRAEPEVLWRAISRMVSTDSCLAVSMKLQVLTTRISASSGCAVRRAPARSSRPIITSESTRFLGQPNEIKPTEGAVGEEFFITVLLYRGLNFSAFLRDPMGIISAMIRKSFQCFGVLLLLCGFCAAQSSSVGMPESLVIARDTFWDIGRLSITTTLFKSRVTVRGSPLIKCS